MRVHQLTILAFHWLSASSAQSFLASGLIEIHKEDFYSLLDMYVLRNMGFLFEEEGDGISMFFAP
jgi:hypothetical protein